MMEQGASAPINPMAMDRELSREADRERDGYYVSSSDFPGWMQGWIDRYANQVELVETKAAAADAKQLDLFAS